MSKSSRTGREHRKPTDARRASVSEPFKGELTETIRVKGGLRLNYVTPTGPRTVKVSF